MSFCSEGPCSGEALSGATGAGKGPVTLRWRKRLDNGVRRVPAPSAAPVPTDRAAGPFAVFSFPRHPLQLDRS